MDIYHQRFQYLSPKRSLTTFPSIAWSLTAMALSAVFIRKFRTSYTLLHYLHQCVSSIASLALSLFSKLRLSHTLRFCLYDCCPNSDAIALYLGWFWTSIFYNFHKNIRSINEVKLSFLWLKLHTVSFKCKKDTHGLRPKISIISFARWVFRFAPEESLQFHLRIDSGNNLSSISLVSNWTMSSIEYVPLLLGWQRERTETERFSFSLAPTTKT